jgi:hypothetical protein
MTTMTQPTTPFEPVKEDETEPHAPLEPVPGEPPREVQEPETALKRPPAV